MFKKVLIANRGEIACRVLRTLKKLGVGSVTVHSEADRHAPHALEADESLCIGPPPALKSYLAVDAILDAAVRTGAEAIHPGYGFLSENAAFAERRRGAWRRLHRPDAGTAPPLRVQALGASPRGGAAGAALARQRALKDDREALEQAERIGFPVMLKSTAGGGGIGMQLCRDMAALPALFDSVQSLAKKNFGEGGVFLEKFVERARHIEVQIFGDGKGVWSRSASATARHSAGTRR